MLSELPFFACAILILAGAIGAMTLRNLVHCALCAAGAFAGLAAIYLQLDAQFAGFAQFLVYVGAVAILIVFTLLLTHNTEIHPGVALTSPSAWVGALVAVLVCVCLIGAIKSSPGLVRQAAPSMEAPVRKIGEQLMTLYIMPLETVGLLLTAALLGAVVIAMREEAKPPPATK